MGWVVCTVPISKLELIPHTHCSVDLFKVIEYASKSADTAPPIDTIKREDSYGVHNGLHRFCAALIRGDKLVKISFWDN
jgi:hypothetical protein